MKLYATTTSERATKGQGGNKYLVTTFTVEHDNGEQEKVGSVELKRGGDSYYLFFTEANGVINQTPIIEIPVKTKGKKQKGESISGCLHEEWRDNRCTKCGYKLN